MTDELPDGVMENGVFRRCQQINCGSNVERGSLTIRTRLATSCLENDSCEHVQDALRWDDELTKLLGAKKVILVGEQLPPVDDLGMLR